MPLEIECVESVPGTGGDWFCGECARYWWRLGSGRVCQVLVEIGYVESVPWEIGSVESVPCVLEILSVDRLPCAGGDLTCEESLFFWRLGVWTSYLVLVEILGPVFLVPVGIWCGGSPLCW